VPAVIGAFFFLLARRKFCGRFWSWAPGMMTWAFSALLYVHIFPPGLRGMGRIVMGLGFHLNPITTVISLGVPTLLEVLQSWQGDLSFWRGRRMRADNAIVLAKER
jgi:hypothetical protein